MAAAFEEALEGNIFLQCWKDTIEGKPLSISIPAHPMNKQGYCEGVLIGGNLTLLAHLVGTPSDVQTRGHILFIEDVGEYLYNVDRMLYQLKRSGKLDGLSGMIVGGFSAMKDTTRPFGKTVEQIIQEILEEYDFPVCFGFPVSHEKENYPLKVGVQYRLEVGNAVSLEEL
jgi:muramoyltetrapeptide carboxypeptidase